MIIILGLEIKNRLDNQSIFNCKIQTGMDQLLIIEQLQLKMNWRMMRMPMKSNKILLLIKKEIFSFSLKLFRTLNRLKQVLFGSRGQSKCLITEPSSRSWWHPRVSKKWRNSFSFLSYGIKYLLLMNCSSDL